MFDRFFFFFLQYENLKQLQKEVNFHLPRIVSKLTVNGRSIMSTILLDINLAPFIS